MHTKTLVATLHLSSVEELPSAQQRIYVLSVEQVSINDVDETKVTDDKIIEKRHDDDDINNFQASKRLSFPIVIPADTTTTTNNDDIHDAHPIILNRLIDALHYGNHKLILRKWKQGARWWNLNRNHTTDASSSTTRTNNNGNGNINNTLSMAKAEVAGYRLAKVAMAHHSEKHQNDKMKKNMICTYVPDVLYFSHDDEYNNTTVDDIDGDPWALFSYFGNNSNNNTEILDEEDADINIRNNSTVKWDLKNANAVMKTSQSSFSHHNALIECNHYPTTMTKTRHEFGFEEPHPRHGRVPIDECLDYAHMILRDVVLPIQFSFFEWSSSSSSAIQPALNDVDWKHNLRALAVDNTQSSYKPFQYHDMIAVYKLALKRLSVAKQTATTVVVDDERMNVLLRMMYECVSALEHEWDDYDGCHPPPLPAVICHMDLQPQNLTFWHDSEKVNDVNTIHVAKHCSVASVMDFEEAAYADPRFEILLLCRKVLANLEQAEELWKSYSSSVKLQTMWDVGPIEPWLRLETVHSLFTLLLQANNLLGGGRNPWETKPDLWGKIDRERLRLVRMGWSFCKNKSGIIS